MTPTTTPHVAATEVDELTVVPRRHIGRWIGAIAVTAFMVWLALSFANAQLDWSIVAEYLTYPVMIEGILIALLLTVISMLIGIAMGVITAVMRMSKNPVTSSVAWLYIWVFRGTPVYLQLLMWFNIALIFPLVFVPGMGAVRTIDIVTRSSRRPSAWA